MLTLIAIIGLLLLGGLIRPLLVKAAQVVLGVGGVVLAGRLALLADARADTLSGAVVGGVVGFVVVGMLGYAIVYHALIRADERRDIERAHETAKRRRLW